jgi:maltooligosyltrehalose trehalohydrolase
MRDLERTIRQGWFFTGQRSLHLDRPRGSDPSGLAPHHFIVCTQNHDQVGNRADGARLNHAIDPAVYRASAALLLLAPQTPLLFMGQEWAAATPFLFFTDHQDELGRRITEGRRAEFGGFSAFADQSRREAIPDPQSPATFARSRLVWSETECAPHRGALRLHQRLLALRAGAAVFRGAKRFFEVRAADDHTLALWYPTEPLLVVVRLSGAAATVPMALQGSAHVALTTEDRDVVDDPRPPLVDASGVTFFRAGAIVIRGLPLAAGAASTSHAESRIRRHTHGNSDD